MPMKIPSSRALLVFEAAAKHGNFARAAQELSLTEGAVSRQVARLETMLNCRLFDRTGSRVKLNPIGARYAQQIRETLERLERDTQSIMGMPEGSTNLDIAALPTFSCRWLIPRLPGFYLQHPDITVNIAARTDPFILAGSGFDAVVHFDHPAWAGMHMQFLFQETLLPICHPALVENKTDNAELNALPRIHRRQNPQAWQHYAQETGIVLDKPAQGIRYDLHEMSIAAALSGQGVAMVPRMYVERELNNGELVAPWPEATSLSKRFFLIKPAETSINNAALHAFERWLLAEIKQET
ncbi:LysR family transcriptional regulator [Chimaeribacter arupi]|uniref:LysR substrate-binding domain-containing protein n=1 Tax=Chimaeribacter arupi TaxID=2060066 RepID=UPI000C7977FF|nr:LysR substrate-binding domain-containing protein [Chimaeribacter arupi]PLR47570.1 LysR family transcriptional regulator [Chimaeribacter arupi]PLR53619.1 LysR family transcriptional regulator [Chimaeribacter arupi]